MYGGGGGGRPLVRRWHAWCGCIYRSPRARAWGCWIPPRGSSRPIAQNTHSLAPPQKTRSFDPMAVVEHDRKALQRYLPKRPPSRKPVPRTERCVFILMDEWIDGLSDGLFLRDHLSMDGWMDGWVEDMCMHIIRTGHAILTHVRSQAPGADAGGVSRPGRERGRGRRRGRADGGGGGVI